MRGRFPTRFLAAVVVATSCAMCWLGWSAYDLYRDARLLTERDVELTRLRGDILHLDEVLTMSARMAAVTGQGEWEVRYNTHEPALTDALTRAEQLAPKLFSGDQVAATNAANEKLVAIEGRAFALVRQRRGPEARALLGGPQYARQKRIYADGMARLAEQMEASSGAALSELHGSVILQVVWIAAGVVLLITAWVVVLKLLRHWRDALADNERALERQAEELAEAVRAGEAVRRIETGQADLNEQMRGEQRLDELARKTITCLADRCGAQIGAIYLMDDTERLRMFGSYAFDARRRLDTHVELGQGLVGQAALEKRSIVLTGVPEDYIAIRSGSVELTPRNILVVPFLREDQVKGVIELGFADEAGPEACKLIERVADSVAVAVHSVQSRQRIQDLLTETQRQSQTLESQQEELRLANDGLQEQTRALEESRDQLRVQQEELEEANQDLELRSEAFRRERDEVRRINERLEATRTAPEDQDPGPAGGPSHPPARAPWRH